MELACDTSLRIKFEALPLPDFWIYIRIRGTLTIRHIIIISLLLLVTTFLFEKSFQQWQQLNRSS
jgi:hypothetical protein